MIISDLSLLEPLDNTTLISGGSGTLVTGTATASGNSSYTYTEANTWASRTSPNGGFVSVGRSTAIATGDDEANTSTYGEAYGNIAIVVSINDPMANAPINYSRSKTIAVGVNTPA